jgi:hypothetical protein
VQIKDDARHAILPVSKRSKDGMDPAKMSVMLLRHSNGKTRRDRFRSAWCSTTSPSISAEDCTARQDSFMSSCLAVQRASEGLVVAEEIIDNGS